jgi:predicted nucleic acid-binding protein
LVPSRAAFESRARFSARARSRNLNLDTHVLLHAVAGKLTAREERLLRKDRWSISRVVLWEIARASTRLDVHVDPAGELIAATSLVHKAPLVTRNRKLLSSKLLPLV